MSRDQHCVAFLRWALPRLGMRWEGFRRVRRQVCRRITARRRALGLADFAAYRDHLDGAVDEWRVLDACCRVTISRFWRDRAIFEALRDVVLPALSTQTRVVRIWSAGCASGEEPYSVAITARELDIDVEIVASDADPHMLERAKLGTYPEPTLRELPKAWRERAFDGGRLHPSFRECVRFVEHDVREPPPIASADLILCRNLAFTYFDEATQRSVLDGMTTLLARDGALVVGGHESLPDGHGLASWARCIYRKKEAR